MSNQSNTSNDKPRTVQDIIDDIKEKSADGTYIFRGEPECYPKISSTLYRECQHIAHVGMKRIQRQILNQAQEHDNNRLGPSQSQRSYFLWSGGYNPFEYTERQFEILAEIQHWGGETNLIDFTRDYHVALFFACDGYYNEDGRVIIQDRNPIKSIIWEPTEPCHRVEAQKSVFVQPCTGFMQPDQVICIPKTLKVPILKYLMRQDPSISIKTIYNDLYGFITMQSRYRSAFVNFYLGVDYEEQGNAAAAMREKHEAYEKAIDHYRDAIKLMPHLFTAHIRCGVVHAQLENFNSALHHFNEAVDWKPDEVDAHHNIGNVYLCKGDYNRAIENYTKAIDLKPDYADAYYSRGDAYWEKGDYDRALGDYTKAIDLKPDYAEAYYNRGGAYNIKGDYDRAIADYTKAIQFNPNYTGAYYLRGLAYVNKSDYDRAIGDLNTAIDLKSNDAQAHYYRGLVLLHLGEWGKAKSDLTTARDMGMDIIALFYNSYSNIADFEQRNGVQLPADIAAMLTLQQ